MNEKKVAISGVGLLAVAISYSAYGYYHAPRMNCSAPPVGYGTQVDSATLQMAENYKECVMSFIREQDDAVDAHIEARKDAVDKWNDFIRDLENASRY